MAVSASSEGGDTESLPESVDELKALVDSSHEIARRVLPLLAEHKIPVTPNNYRIWYEYCLGGSEVLKETLDRMVDDGIEFTPEVTRALFQRFFSLEATEHQSRLVDKAGEKIQSAATEFIKSLLVTIVETGEYSQSLGSHAERIERARDLDEVREIITSILDETGGVLRAQDTIQREMEQMSRELAELQEELRRSEELAHTDELTGLFNRRAFNVRLAEEMGRARRYGNALAIIMLDLDDFKDVNDTHGHLVGDRVLTMTAKAIKRTIRGPDYPCRFGGEEFAVTCPQTDLKGAIRLADRLCKAIGDVYFNIDGVTVRVTVSVGVAAFKADKSMNDLIERADKAMFLAKVNGKNMVRNEEDLDAAL